MNAAKSKGMTLVEVLIAATVFALVMLALATAFSTFGRTFARLQEETSGASRIREVEQFLRDTLRSAVSSPGLFKGSAGEVRWVAPIDRVGGAGGLQYLKLSQRGDQLVLRFAPFAFDYDEEIEPAWSSVVSDIALLEGLDALSLSYRLHSDAGWQRQSQPLEGEGGQSHALPLAVRMDWTVDGRERPPMITQLERYGLSQ